MVHVWCILRCMYGACMVHFEDFVWCKSFAVYTYCSSDEDNYYNNNNTPNIIFDSRMQAKRKHNEFFLPNPIIFLRTQRMMTMMPSCTIDGIRPTQTRIPIQSVLLVQPSQHPPPLLLHINKSLHPSKYRPRMTRTLLPHSRLSVPLTLAPWTQLVTILTPSLVLQSGTNQ